MRSSSDGALVQRAKAPFDTDVQGLLDSKRGVGVGTAAGGASTSEVGRCDERGRQEWHGRGPCSQASTTASIAEQASVLTPPLKVASRAVPGARDSCRGVRRAAKALAGRPPRKGRSIPRVSQMFIQAIGDLQNSQASDGDAAALIGATSASTDARPWPKIVDSSRMAIEPPSAADEPPPMCSGRNSTAEFGTRYAVLRVKVRRSFRKHRLETRRQMEGKSRRREARGAPRTQTRSVEVGEVAPGEMTSSAGPGTFTASRSVKAEGLAVDMPPDSQYDDSCMNVFWCLWVVGFIFPLLWVGGATGILTRSQCGFIAGMANVMALIVAAIIIAIFIA